MKIPFRLFLLCLLCFALPLATAQERKAGDRMTLTINGVEYHFRWCPPGTLMMGSPESELGRNSNEKQHQVTLSRAFWLLETPVTQAMWESVMRNNPSIFKGPKLPVEKVSWNNSQDYLRRLNGLDVAPAGYRFSLPTEAQWEYACRAGTTTAFHFGDTLDKDQANFLESKIGKTTEVGLYPANAWGLYDMHGNVWELCLDRYGAYPTGSVTDPVGPSSGDFRVFRGGSWDYFAEDCRSASRNNDGPSLMYSVLGLRLALVPAQ
ncbi:MAG: formylglycine-generating enzyme family protein [Planctomycetaceae bacterium]|nr:formylglycine-generating enzyme family protein [Planctomycetaceae bacterium]